MKDNRLTEKNKKSATEVVKFANEELNNFEYGNLITLEESKTGLTYKAKSFEAEVNLEYIKNQYALNQLSLMQTKATLRNSLTNVVKQIEMIKKNATNVFNQSRQNVQDELIEYIKNQPNYDEVVTQLTVRQLDSRDFEILINGQAFKVDFNNRVNQYLASLDKLYVDFHINYLNSFEYSITEYTMKEIDSFFRKQDSNLEKLNLKECQNYTKEFEYIKTKNVRLFPKFIKNSNNKLVEIQLKTKLPKNISDSNSDKFNKSYILENITTQAFKEYYFEDHQELTKILSEIDKAEDFRIQELENQRMELEEKNSEYLENKAFMKEFLNDLDLIYKNGVGTVVEINSDDTVDFKIQYHENERFEDSLSFRDFESLDLFMSEVNSIVSKLNNESKYLLEFEKNKDLNVEDFAEDVEKTNTNLDGKFTVTLEEIIPEIFFEKFDTYVDLNIKIKKNKNGSSGKSTIKKIGTYHITEMEKDLFKSRIQNHLENISPFKLFQF